MYQFWNVECMQVVQLSFIPFSLRIIFFVFHLAGLRWSQIRRSTLRTNCDFRATRLRIQCQHSVESVRCKSKLRSVGGSMIVTMMIMMWMRNEDVPIHRVNKMDLQIERRKLFRLWFVCPRISSNLVLRISSDLILWISSDLIWARKHQIPLHAQSYNPAFTFSRISFYFKMWDMMDGAFN